MYTRKNWNTGDIVRATEMNNIEDGIERAHNAIDALPAPPNLEPYATKDWVANEIGNIDIPSLDGYLQQSDLAPYATTAAVQDMIADIPPPDLTGYATEDFVQNAINQAELGGGEAEIDLSVYALKTELNSKVDKVTGKGLSTVDFTNELKAKLDGIEVGAQKNPDLTQYALKSDLKDATQLEFNGVPLDGLRRYVYETNAVEGEWSIDYSDKGFTTFVNVYFYSIAKGTALADRTIPTLKQGQPTLTSCSGYLMSASSAGLLAAMTLVNGSGPVRVIVEGV